jgi:hypothetical protein
MEQLLKSAVPAITHAADHLIELVDGVMNRYYRMSVPEPMPRALHRPKPRN